MTFCKWDLIVLVVALHNVWMIDSTEFPSNSLYKQCDEKCIQSTIPLPFWFVQNVMSGKTKLQPYPDHQFWHSQQRGLWLRSWCGLGGSSATERSASRTPPLSSCQERSHNASVVLRTMHSSIWLQEALQMQRNHATCHKYEILDFKNMQHLNVAPFLRHYHFSSVCDCLWPWEVLHLWQ